MSGSVRGVEKHAGCETGRCALPLLYDRAECSRSLTCSRITTLNEAVHFLQAEIRRPWIW